MKVLSWNINGFKSFVEKIRNLEQITQMLAKMDVLCFQETKITLGNFEQYFGFFKELGFNFQYLNESDQKGTAGVVVMCKKKPQSVTFQLLRRFKGRVIQVHIDDVYLVNVYTPHIGMELEKYERRKVWHREFLAYLKKLPKNSFVIGDLNVAPFPIDVRNPEAKKGKAGFTEYERKFFIKLLTLGWVDVFRYLYPDKEQFTFFDKITRAYERNSGWRLDFVLTKEPKKISQMRVLDTKTISDHLALYVKMV